MDRQILFRLGSCLLLGLFLTGLVVGIAGQAGQPRSIRVMTYNIRYDNPEDGIHAWPHRKDAVAELFTRYQVDLAGLQEALKDQVDDLAARLPGYAWIGVGRDDGQEKGEFSPVFYRQERFKVLEQGTFWLSETPEVPGSKSWDAAITRIATWAKFRDLRTRKNFYHFNTHFDHRGVEARKYSAYLLLAKIRSIARREPAIVTGDLNAQPGSDPYLALLGSGLTDAFSASRAGHQGPTSTFTDWSEPGPADSRIDYVFVRRGFAVLSHQTLTDRLNGYFPSDHLPVLAELEPTR